MNRIVIRRATTRSGRLGFVADLITPGSPVFPIVAWVSTLDEVADVLDHYLPRHPGTAVEMPT